MTTKGMSIKKLIALFITVFLLITVFTVPVGLIVKQFNLPKNVSYDSLQGTLWQGSIKAAQYKKTVLTQVQWQWLPWQLFKGKVAFKLRWGNARVSQQLSGTAVASVGFSGYQLNDTTVRLPASAVKPLLPFPMGDLYGRVIADINSYSFGEPLCSELNGELVWTKAGVDINGVIDFGVISSALSCDNNQVLATFDGQNSLGLQGLAKLESQTSFSFDGFLKPDASLPAVVHQGIGMFGKADSQGRFKISL
ncbi:MAG: type II secretion system protein N [Gammaproteobacteria bacterium]|nr:type II secretion system protein N [Gammaproteobacteria bacterium]